VGTREIGMREGGTREGEEDESKEGRKESTLAARNRENTAEPQGFVTKGCQQTAVKLTLFQFFHLPLLTMNPLLTPPATQVNQLMDVADMGAHPVRHPIFYSVGPTLVDGVIIQVCRV
jgi:hypothetical protein